MLSEIFGDEFAQFLNDDTDGLLDEDIQKSENLVTHNPRYDHLYIYNPQNCIILAHMNRVSVFPFLYG